VERLPSLGRGTRPIGPEPQSAMVSGG